ncbi:hypothetical protein LUZ63_000307 [Rhynchospora breviuscula]|uniref:Heat shock protein 70 n=1 Tax=Rhynchospora breviuscula TaxID=2022672 RepID=A0A9Q0HWR4_9POAL|nr:hypothetical protein LUZ63_000307 [Rhynchospora breviuscula]
MWRWPFKVVAGQNDRLLVEVNWKGKLWQFTPAEICSMILIRVKRNAETNLVATITDAVMTIPVQFNYEQRQAIKEAGLIAGLNVMQIVSAPAASALLFGTERLSDYSNIVSTIVRYISRFADYNMIIVDLGAGTLDVSLTVIKDGVCKVRATAGDVHLGGSDFDANMVYDFVKWLERNGYEDAENNFRTIMREHRTVFEEAKFALSSGSNMAPIMIGPLYNNEIIEFSISATKFNELNKELFLKCVGAINMCLRNAKMGVGMVNEIILVGGSTRIPFLQALMNPNFKNKLMNAGNYFETAVASGAALQAFFLSSRGYERVPCLSLQNATSFPLGILVPKVMSFCIPKNTTIPTSIEKIIPSSLSNKGNLLIEVYEGEEILNRESKLLGKLDLSGVLFSSNGCDFKVCFELDINGTLTVVCGDSSAGVRNAITLNTNNIEVSQKSVWDALTYKEIEKVSNSLTESGTHKTNQIGDKQVSRLPTVGDEKSKMIMGQSSRQHIDKYAIGIDFGTTNSCVAVWKRNAVKIIENEYGSRTTCSCVAFTDTGRLIGDMVNKEQVTTNPANTTPNVKRLIGRCYSEQSANTGKIFPPLSVVKGNNSRAMVSVQYTGEDKHFAPEEIAAMVLTKMKEIAEAHLGCMVTKAVITVPACFSDSQRKAIKDAGIIAGLNVMQLLNEPTAAAIAYYHQKVDTKSPDKKTVLIFDLGGGNLDVSIVTVHKGTLKVLAVVGDTNLGGEDFDNNLVCHFVENFMKEKNRDISNKPRSLRRLRAACEKAKRVLSTNAQTVVEVDALDEGIDFRSSITREAFEELNRRLFQRSLCCVEGCLEDARMDRTSINEVILVGGSTRIPKLQQLLQDFFNRKEPCKSMNADEAVAYGAAVRAAMLIGNTNKFNKLKIEDITSLSVGLESKNGAIMNLLIPKHTPVPAKREVLITTCSDNLSSISIEVQECELALPMVFILSGITPKPRSNSKINVSFEVDNNGILNLTAKNISTREKNQIVVSKKNDGLTPEDIKKMVEAAARFKAEDEEHKVRTAALNSLENFAYKMKATARDPKGSASEKKRMDKAADEAIAWLETNHHAKIEEIDAWKRKLETIKSQVAFL